MEPLVTISVNAIGRIRRETLNGRQYVVASATLIVPGVLPGSGGPLLYPLEEIRRNFFAWNGMPVTLGHPMRDGMPISARQPSVWRTSVIGTLFNVSAEDKLRGEIWFDVETTRRADPSILNRLERGEPIELSTGLFLDPDSSVSGKHEGRDYVAVARNYRPDHLAVLTDSRGACSIADGCGVLINEPPANNQGDEMNREQLIQWLTINCDCWKGKTELLNKLTDDDLKALKANADAIVANREILTRERQALADANGVIAAVRSGLGVETLPAIAEIPTFVKSKLTTNANPAPVPTPTPNTTPAPAKITMTELLANATEEERAAWAYSQKILADRKAELIEKIVGNAATDEAKAAMRPLYARLRIDELEQIARHVPTPAPAVNYFPGVGPSGAGAAPTVNVEDLLLPPGVLPPLPAAK